MVSYKINPASLQIITSIGVYFRPNGKKIEGEWLNGVQHGECTITETDGTQKIGEWSQGKRVKKLT